jgi:hypothetical protein
LPAPDADAGVEPDSPPSPLARVLAPEPPCVDGAGCVAAVPSVAAAVELGVVGNSDVVDASPCACVAAEPPEVGDEPEAPGLADAAALAEARCEATAAGAFAAGALPADVPVAGAEAVGAEAVGVEAVDEDDAPWTPAAAVPGTDDGPEPGCAVASDSVLDATPFAAPAAPVAPWVLAPAVDAVPVPVPLPGEPAPADSAAAPDSATASPAVPATDWAVAPLAAGDAAAALEAGAEEPPRADALAAAAVVAAPPAASPLGWVVPVALVFDTVVPAACALATAPVDEASPLAALAPVPAVAARSRRRSIDLSRWLASEPVCLWPSAGAVRAQCSASALSKGGAPGGADGPGGAPDVGGDVDGGGVSAATKFMPALP